MNAFPPRNGPARSLTGAGNRLNEYDPIRRLVLCPATSAYGDQARLDAAWHGEEFLDPAEQSGVHEDPEA